jgi:DNA-binding NarL/FixJ family response regulator
MTTDPLKSSPLATGMKSPNKGHAPSGLPGMPTTVRLLLCDDQKLVRTRVRQLFKELASIQVVGEAADGASAVKLALELEPDIVLMDVSMPHLDGIEATRQILAKSPDIHILAFSSDFDPETVKKMRAVGARGFVFKGADLVELLVALQKIAAGESFVTVGPSSRRHWPRHD